MSDQDIMRFRIEKLEKEMDDLKSELKEGMEDFKSEVRGHLKETKENQKIMTETMIIMRENSDKQTTII